MSNTILAAVGFAVTAAALIFLLKNFMLKQHGETALAEVTAVNEEKRRNMAVGRNGRAVSGYIHTLVYEANGKTCKSKDKTGYNQPFSVGSKHTVIYNKAKPEDFEYAEQVDRNIKLFAGLAAMGIVFAVKFMLTK